MAKRAAKKSELQLRVDAFLNPENECCGVPMQSGFDVMFHHRVNAEINCYYIMCMGYCANVETVTAEDFLEDIEREKNRW